MKFRAAMIIFLAILASMFGPWPAHAATREYAVCSHPSASQAACFAKIYAAPDGSVTPDSTPAGYGPAQLRAA